MPNARDYCTIGVMFSFLSCITATLQTAQMFSEILRYLSARLHGTCINLFCLFQNSHKN